MVSCGYLFGNFRSSLDVAFWGIGRCDISAGVAVGLEISGYQALRDKYLDQLSHRLKDVQADILTATGPSSGGGSEQDAQGATQRVYDVLHQISGSAGSFDLAAVGTAARACADIALGHIETAQAMTPQVAQSLSVAFANVESYAQDAITDAQSSQFKGVGQ